MMRTLCALSLALLSASAQAGEHRDAVMDLLNAYELTALQADLQAIGDGVDAELLEIAQDAEIPTSRRGRAVSALQYYPTNAVRGFLEVQLAEADKALLSRKAAYALAGGWGADAVELLTGALASDDVQLRIAAANALAGIEGEAARAALETRKGVETEDAVNAVLDKALGVTQ